MDSLFGISKAPTYTWSTKPAASVSSGVVIKISDIGESGSLWISNGALWKPLNNTLGLKAINTRVNVPASTSETVVGQVALPAAVLAQYDRVRVWSTFSKGGTTDTGTVNFKIGTAGTTADTTVYGGTAFNAASRTLATINDFKIADATHCQHVGNNSSAPLVGAYIGVNSSAAYPSAVEIANISNALYLSLTITTGGNDAIALEDAYFQLLTTP